MSLQVLTVRLGGTKYDGLTVTLMIQNPIGRSERGQRAPPPPATTVSGQEFSSEMQQIALRSAATGGRLTENDGQPHTEERNLSPSQQSPLNKLFQSVGVRHTQDKTIKMSPDSKRERSMLRDHSRRPTTTGAIELRIVQSTIMPAWNEELICGLQDMMCYLI